MVFSVSSASCWFSRCIMAPCDFEFEFEPVQIKQHLLPSRENRGIYPILSSKWANRSASLDLNECVLWPISDENGWEIFDRVVHCSCVCVALMVSALMVSATRCVRKTVASTEIRIAATLSYLSELLQADLIWRQKKSISRCFAIEK